MILYGIPTGNYTTNYGIGLLSLLIDFLIAPGYRIAMLFSSSLQNNAFLIGAVIQLLYFYVTVCLIDLLRHKMRRIGSSRKKVK